MNRLPHALKLALLGSCLVAVAQAHPGHDGHEITWDIDHLVAHPGATVFCLGVLALGAWGAYRVALLTVKWRRSKQD